MYFADPYQSNQRARNENTNGLIRQYLPKSMRLDQLDPAYVASIERALNTRPRKTLAWKTPEQVLSGFNVLHFGLESALLKLRIVNGFSLTYLD